MQVMLEDLDERRIAIFLDAQRLRNRRDDQRGIADGRQRHKKDAVLKIVQQIGGHLERQARLAGSPGPGQGQQAHVGAPQQCADSRHLSFSPDKQSGERRQIVGAEVERPERRKIGRQIRGDHLVDALGPGDVSQAALAQVARLDAGRQALADQLQHCPREQNLSAVPGRDEAIHTVERWAVIVAAALFGRPGVKRHAHSQRELVPVLRHQRALSRESRRHAKNGVTRIADGFENTAPAGFDGVAHERVVAGQRRRHRLRTLFPEFDAARNVGKEKNKMSGWQIWHWMFPLYR